MQAQIDKLAGRVLGLREELRGSDPLALARRVDGAFDPAGASFTLRYWEQPFQLRTEDWTVWNPDGTPASSYTQAMLLYHCRVSDGCAPSGRWISFSALPDARFYNQAFQGYSGQPLSAAFQNDLAAFEQAAQQAGGQRDLFGDSAYRWLVLPKVPLRIVYWAGDDELAARAQIQFDETASRHLPTDACALLGSELSRKVLKVKGAAK